MTPPYKRFKRAVVTPEGIGIEGGPVRIRKKREPDDGGLTPTVIELATYAGFDFCWRIVDPTMSMPGLPDVFLARFPKPHYTPRLILAECKRDRDWHWSKSKRTGLSPQKEVLLGLLELSAWPRALTLDPALLAGGFPMEAMPLKASHEPGSPVRVETYLWQPHQMEQIKAILWHGAPNPPL